MRTTIKVENEARDGRANSDEYFAFQEKVNDILEQHDEVLVLHMNILKVSNRNLFIFLFGGDYRDCTQISATTHCTPLDKLKFF